MSSQWPHGRSIARQFVVSYLLLSLAIPVAAQTPTGTVTGRVMAGKVPVAGANVSADRSMLHDLQAEKEHVRAREKHRRESELAAE